MSAIGAKYLRPTHLRLVHPPRPLLTKAQLALFEEPKTWDEILELEPRMSAEEWRICIVDCDDAGWAFLTWSPAPKRRRNRFMPPMSGVRLKGTWKLTARGADYIRRKR